MTIGYLGSYSSITLRWTDTLSDHLILLKGASWKSLYVYSHPAFIKQSLRVLRESNRELGQSVTESIALGCLPPRLLLETLKTYELLFPDTGDARTRFILEKAVERRGLDREFLQSWTIELPPHEHFRDALDPSDMRGLHEKFPYWGPRLYDIWKDADDPIPITRIERWSEAKRNTRFTYWCTVVAVRIAIMFSVVASALGAVQVWISYCDVVGDPSTRPRCELFSGSDQTRGS